MAGSTTRLGGVSRSSAAERQRQAVADRERRDDPQQRPRLRAEQQQADQEQDVIRPDQDVMHARRHERRRHRQRAAYGPRIIHALGRAAIEDALIPERAILIDVDERLMDPVVGEEQRPHGERARPAA
jgi:hypothetical protein